jgi:hypothetical protein
MKNLFLISFLVYLGVNLAENLIHYNIGKYSNTSVHMDLPTPVDGVKIIMVMLTFAVLQGVLTCHFEGCK